MKSNLKSQIVLAEEDNYLWNSELKQYLRKEEDIEPYMDTIYYVLNPHKFDEKMSLETLLFLYHDIIHKLLWNFLAKPPLRVIMFGRKVYPGDSILGKNLQALSKICEQLNGVTNVVDLIELIRSGSRFGFTDHHMAELISQAYGKLEIMASELRIAKQRCVIDTWKPFDMKKYKEYDPAYLRPVIDFKKFINKDMSEYLVNAFIHGSLSTFDYKKGFSDFDTLLIVKQSVVDNVDKLLNLRKLYSSSIGYLFALDPWQHHSHFVICQYDMNFYNQAVFPLTLFKYSTGLLENTTHNAGLSFSLRNDVLECKYAFWSRIAEFRDICLNNRYPQTFFAFKRLIAVVLLLPCLCLGLDRQHTYKKYSFGKVRTQLHIQPWEVIDGMTIVRDLCPSARTMPGPLYKNLVKYYPQLIRQAFIKFNNDVPKPLINALGPNYLSEVFEFVECMVKQVKERNLL